MTCSRANTASKVDSPFCPPSVDITVYFFVTDKCVWEKRSTDRGGRLVPMLEYVANCR